jgi:hypothetical protein
MASTRQYYISDFSPHLFWDTDKSKLDLDANKAQVIQQVLEYGLLADWLIIFNVYGLESIAETSCKFRQLEPRALSFIAALSGIAPESFRCYSIQRSIPPHWNF